MDKVADKALELLSQLAVKLGVTVQYLWPKYVELVRIEWITGTIVTFICSIIFGLLFKKVFTKFNASNYDDEGQWAFLCFVTGAILLLSGIGFFLHVINIANLLVPEPEALRRIISAISPSK